MALGSSAATVFRLMLREGLCLMVGGFVPFSVRKLTKIQQAS